MPRLHYLLLLFVFSGMVCLPAQTPAYLHYSISDGLPSTMIYCGLQDPEGFLWFGTDKGLACFDGIRFHVYDMKDGLPDPEVLNLKIDSRGRMWISCFQHKPCYMFHGKIYNARRDTMLKNIVSETGRWVFYEDADSTLWLMDNSGQTYRIRNQKVDKIVFAPDISNISRFGRIGNALIFLTSRGFWRLFDKDSLELVNDLSGNNPTRKVWGFFNGQFSGSQVLVSNAEQLVLFQWDGKKLNGISAVPYPPAYIFKDLSANFWVCTNSGGAYFFGKNLQNLERSTPFLTREKINSMFEDRQGGIWFLTPNNGVFCLPKNAPVNFSQTDHLPSENILSLAKGENGIVYAGDDIGNINLIRGKLEQTLRLGTRGGNNRVRQIITTAGSDSIWVCADGGIFLINQGKSQKIRGDLNPKSFARSNDGIWFASSVLLGLIPRDTFDYKTIKIRRYTCVQADDEGYIWAGGITGLFSRPDTFKNNWGDQFPFLKGRIISIQPGGSHKLWVATPENGLLGVETEKGRVKSVHRMNDSLSTAIENIQSIYPEPGDPNKLWLATNHGVFGLDNHSNTAHFDAFSGLADDDVNAVLLNGDTLWAATASGLTRIIMEPEKANSEFSTYITGLHYHAHEHAVDSNFIGDQIRNKTIVLPEDATQVALELTGMDFRSRGNFHFVCIRTEKLLPLRHWTPGNFFTLLKTWFSGKTDTLYLQNGNLNFGYKLPAGKYNLKIWSMNTAGIRSNLPDRADLIMLPHWYETIWFWGLIWGILLAAAYGFYRNRIAFRELNAAASELQLLALQGQMNPHFVGNSINAIQQFFYPPDPLKASEYIATFNRLLRQTMVFSESTFIPLGEEIAYDRDYLQMVQLRFGERFRYDISETGGIDPATPFPAMILQPLLENATLHGLAWEGISSLELQFGMAGREIIVTLTDNGPGISRTMQRKTLTVQSDRKSKGLELLYKKVQMINRRYGIDLIVKISDLSDLDKSLSGTQVVISYIPDKKNN